MPQPDIRLAQPSERDLVLDALTLSFSADPCVRFTFASAQSYLASFRTFAMAMGGAALEQGTAYVAEGGAASALWLPPGVQSDTEALGQLIGGAIEAEKLEDIGAVVESMGQYHPHEPHWYLAMVGVDPARQGQGLGSAILKESLRRCDADGVIAYLESSNPKNIPLYERHGFEVMGVIQPGAFPPMYPMLRPARG